MNKILQYTILLLIMVSCSTTGPELPTWMEGDWKTNNKSGFAGENWRMINDTLLAGQGLVHVAGQLRVMEEISVFISQSKMYYGAIVSDQNGGKQVLFKATHVSDGHLVFENPGHDFPTHIVYKLKDQNTLEVNISGRDEEDTNTVTLYRR